MKFQGFTKLRFGDRTVQRINPQIASEEFFGKIVLLTTPHLTVMDCHGDAYERDTGNTAQERKIWSYIIFGLSMFWGISVDPLMPVLISPRHH